MTEWISADLVFDGRRLSRNAAIRLENGRATALAPLAELPEGVSTNHAGYLLSPGFVDLQVNGGGGILFNREPTPDGVLAIARAHRALGTTRLMPTVITDSAPIMEAAAEAILQVRGREGVLGIHIEGPHISQSRKGAHDPRHIRPLDDRTFSLVQRMRDAGVPVLLTLAPEAVRPGQIARLSEMGAIVSIGHSDAASEQVREALDEGASFFTHLFNAMSQMESRKPGVVGTAIASEAWCSAIFDGHHVAPEMLRIACSARPRSDRMILVSDAMPTVGGPDSFELYGETLLVEGGRLLNRRGVLSGAHLDMRGAVAYAAKVVGLPLEDALRMAVANPLEAIGLEDTNAIVGAGVEEIIVVGAEIVDARPLREVVAEI